MYLILCEASEIIHQSATSNKGDVVIAEDGILYIEPQNPPNGELVVDDLAWAMATQLFVGLPGPAYRGVHQCSCGVTSSNCDYMLVRGGRTNSLCVHYLARHREEVPQGQLKKVEELEYIGFVRPTDEEMLALCHGIMP